MAHHYTQELQSYIMYAYRNYFSRGLDNREILKEHRNYLILSIDI